MLCRSRERSSLFRSVVVRSVAEGSNQAMASPSSRGKRDCCLVRISFSLIRFAYVRLMKGRPASPACAVFPPVRLHCLSPAAHHSRSSSFNLSTPILTPSPIPKTIYRSCISVSICPRSPRDPAAFSIEFLTLVKPMSADFSLKH